MKLIKNSFFFVKKWEIQVIIFMIMLTSSSERILNQIPHTGATITFNGFEKKQKFNDFYFIVSGFPWCWFGVENLKLELNLPKSDYIHYFPTHFEANGIVVWNSKLSACYLILDTLLLYSILQRIMNFLPNTWHRK